MPRRFARIGLPTMLLLTTALAAPALGQFQDEPVTLALDSSSVSFTARADDDASERSRLAEPRDRPRAERPFSKGTWSLEPMSFALFDVSSGARADLYGVGVGAGYYFADGHAVRVEAYGVGVSQSGDDALGGGGSVHGRWHFLRQPRFTLYFEGGGGMLQTSVSLPDGPRERDRDGTHFNFTASAILGMTFKLDAHLHLTAAVRYTHISNARRRGASRNPSTEAVGGYLGLMRTF